MIALVTLFNRDRLQWHLIDMEKDQLPDGGGLYVEYRGETVSEILHTIQEKKDNRFYLDLGWVDSKHRHREEEYPKYCELYVLTGYVKEVCDICMNRAGLRYSTTWEVDYPLELWVREGDVIQKVQGFTEKVKADLDSYIKEHGLQWDS